MSFTAWESATNTLPAKLRIIRPSIEGRIIFCLSLKNVNLFRNAKRLCHGGAVTVISGFCSCVAYFSRREDYLQTKLRDGLCRVVIITNWDGVGLAASIVMPDPEDYDEYTVNCC